jgi:2-dehydropantoate 2-reductase
MRFVVVGLGAIGGTLAVRLWQAGYPVVGVARGAQGEAIVRDGLRLETPAERVTASIDVVHHIGEVTFGRDDVVVLAVKSQDTSAILSAMVGVVPPETPVLCAQNGVVNEASALRFFPRVYGVVVMCPAAFLRPGVVQAHSSPITGLLDVGCYPGGEDSVSRMVAALLNEATFDARSIPDVMRWKYAKLLINLGNAAEAVCGPEARSGPLTRLLREEGETVLRAAGVDYASAEEDRTRRGDLLVVQPAGGEARSGGSTWQSLVRGTGATEVDYLSGEVVMLGRLHGIPTPANAYVQKLTADLARAKSQPGIWTDDEVLAELSRTAVDQAGGAELRSAIGDA